MTQLDLLNANGHYETALQAEEKGRIEQLKIVGSERLKKLIPADTKAVIVAELHEDESDSMTDYFSYITKRTVILGFSNHTKDVFAEMRKYAANFNETAYLAENRREYEHREKYAGGEGYYLGKSRYSGWIVRKVKYYRDRENIINAFALIAGDENNIFVREQSSETATLQVSGDFLIVNYTPKSLAVFGDTKLIKDRLKKLGGRFNPFLMHENEKRAGWIFSMNREQQLRKLLNN